MAEPLIQVDDDWKKKAQEEKRRLAEQAKPAKPAAASAPAPSQPSPASGASDDEPADFDGLVRSLLTQCLLYLGMLRAGGERMMDLNAARRQVDLLAVLKDKTRGNLSDGENDALRMALHEARTRFVAVASQQII